MNQVFLCSLMKRPQKREATETHASHASSMMLSLNFSPPLQFDYSQQLPPFKIDSSFETNQNQVPSMEPHLPPLPYLASRFNTEPLALPSWFKDEKARILGTNQLS